MREIDEKEALKMGISTIHHEMDNGERRFRLKSHHGSSYILTLGNSKSSWQKAHVHHESKELYLIEKGMALMIMGEEDVRTIILREDGCIMVKPDTPHNLYICSNSVIHTIKYGREEDDWYACPHLDEICQHIDIEKMLKK